MPIVLIRNTANKQNFGLRAIVMLCVIRAYRRLPPTNPSARPGSATRLQALDRSCFVVTSRPHWFRRGRRSPFDFAQRSGYNVTLPVFSWFRVGDLCDLCGSKLTNEKFAMARTPSLPQARDQTRALPRIYGRHGRRYRRVPRHSSFGFAPATPSNRAG
jgi:hypothetical protein